MSAAVGTLLRPVPPRAVSPGALMNATIVDRVDLTDAIAVFRVRADDGPPTFVPGQYFSLGLAIDGALVRRPYSTASAPGSAELEFLVRRVPGGTFTPVLWRTTVGSRVALGRAKGLFTLQPDDERAHLFVATGTGLAPFVAMVGALQERPRPPRSIVVHGVVHAAELAFRDRLAGARTAASIHYLPAVSRPTDPRNVRWDGHVGRVTDVLPGVFAEGSVHPRSTVAYLCGNPGMIESASALLADLGLPAEAIVSERYWTASPA